MSTEFLSDEANAAELVGHMNPYDQAVYRSFGHLRIEAAFLNRIFIVYKPTGLTKTNQHREPEVITTLRVVGFSASEDAGGQVLLEDRGTCSSMTVRHVPKRLFDYPIFACVPTRLHLRWDARIVDERVERSLSFALLLKTRNRSNFYSAGNTYLETPNSFKELYPSVTGNAGFVF